MSVATRQSRDCMRRRQRRVDCNCAGEHQTSVATCHSELQYKKTLAEYCFNSAGVVGFGNKYNTEDACLTKKPAAMGCAYALEQEWELAEAAATTVVVGLSSSFNSSVVAIW
jgi:hypothetical protein